MTDISYLSEFLSKLFNISHKDYVVETDPPNVVISESNMAEGETIEDIELEIADMMKEFSESGVLKMGEKKMQPKPLYVSVVQFQDCQPVSMVDISKDSRTRAKRMSKMECQVYVKDPQPNTMRNDSMKLKDDYTDPNNNENANDSNEQNIIKKCWVGLRKLDPKKVEMILVGNEAGMYVDEKYQIERSSRSEDDHELEFEDSANSIDEDPCGYKHGQVDFVSKKCWVGISKLDPLKVQMLLNGVNDDRASIKNSVDSNLNVLTKKEDIKNGRKVEYRCADLDMKQGLGNVSATDTVEGSATLEDNDGIEISSKSRDPVAGIIGNVGLMKNAVGAAEDVGTTVSKYRDKNFDNLSEEVNKENLQHEMMILDEVQEDSNTTSTFDAIDDEDFANFLNYCKDDHAQARVTVSNEASSIEKKPKNLKNKLKKAAKTVFKKIRVPNQKYRVQAATNPAVKMAFSTSSQGHGVKLEKFATTTTKDGNEGSRDPVTLKRDSDDVNDSTAVSKKKMNDLSESKSSLYSDNILNNFFNPWQSQSQKEKVSLFKIPKLPRVCSPQSEENKDNVIVKGREPASAKKTPIDQMVMVEKEKKISKLLPACSPQNEKSKESEDIAKGRENTLVKKSPNVQMVTVDKERNISKLPPAFTTHKEKRKEEDGMAKGRSEPSRAMKTPMDVEVYKERRIPKLPRPLYDDMAKEREHARVKKSPIDQMVIVDKERVTLGTFLTNEGIIPGVDVRKLMVSDVDTKGDGVVSDKRALKLLPMDKEELDDIYHKNWETMKKITTDEERQKLSRIAFENRVPAKPGNNLTYHGYRGRARNNEDGRSYRHHHQYLGPIFPVGSVAIKQGALEPLPGYKRKHREYEVDRREVKRRKIEYKNFSLYMKSLYFERYQSKMKGEQLSQGLFEDFQYFMKHVNSGQEETENFLSFYSNKAVMMDEVQVDEVSDTENMFSSFKVFYGKSDVAKCTSCDTYHLFSQ